MTEYFQYHDQQLYAEGVPLSHIAEQWGTPCYIYSRAALKNNWQAFNNAFSKRPHRICYAVKANSNLAILQLYCIDR
jgi:diaminopimelate decarboxylase